MSLSIREISTPGLYLRRGAENVCMQRVCTRMPRCITGAEARKQAARG